MPLNKLVTNDFERSIVLVFNANRDILFSYVDFRCIFLKVDIGNKLAHNRSYALLNVISIYFTHRN